MADMAALDFASLREESLARIQRLAGTTWTDHNAHDPGITILEQVCYALTDLAYRAQFEMPDLLAREGEAAYASLYTPGTILPSGPVTITDLRKLLLDVPGVRNAWIEVVDAVSATHDTTEATVRYAAASESVTSGTLRSPTVSDVRPVGVYRVRIEKSDLVDIDGGEIRRAAAQRLHEVRALGVDYAAIDVLDAQDVQLDATIEIASVGDATDLLARIYAAGATYCSPPVPFHTLADMLSRGRRIDQIFEGPRLQRGFIDPDELAGVERRTELRISDLIHAMSSVPGVVAVKQLHFLVNGQRSRDWLLTVDPGRAPRFDPQNSIIRLERRSLRVDSDVVKEQAQRLFTERAANAAQSAPPRAADLDVLPPPGRTRHVGAYRSLQPQFPMSYGIGPAGLPQSASPERRAQAKQLKAYLLFYDQLLANYFAQLANVGTLFSFHDESPSSYFSQPVADEPDDALDLDSVRRTGAAHGAVLQQITEGAAGADAAGPTAGLRRRHRFLDHLLARVGEQFLDYSLLQLGASGIDDVSALDRLAGDKRAFLRDYPRIGRDRGVGFNYLAPATLGSSAFVPGDVTDPVLVVRRLTAELPDPLSAFLWTQASADEQQTLADPNAGRAACEVVLVSLLNRVVHAGAPLFTAERFDGVTRSEEAIRLLARDPAVSGDDLVRLNRVLLEDAYPGAVARSRAADNVSGLELVLRRKLGIRDDEERFHLVEHILLRPIAADGYQTGPLLRASRLRDPYSLQISLVFPNWPARYRDPSFRQFVEDTVREQAPAHLTAYVRWLDRPAMAAFEAAYADWVHQWRNHRLAELGV